MYINQNVKPTITNLKAPRMSIQDFKDVLLNGIIKDKDNHEEYLGRKYYSNNYYKNGYKATDINLDDPSWISEYIELWNNSEYSEEMDNIILDYISSYGGWNVKLHSDLEIYTRDWENCEINSWGITINDIPYIECKTYGDWEEPICIYIYYDGEQFRGYIPTKGNTINLFDKSAFGNNRGDFNILNPDKSGDDHFDISKYSQTELDKFKKSDFYFLMSELYPSDSNKLIPSEENWNLFYEDLEKLEINWESCREEFESIISAI